MIEDPIIALILTTILLGGFGWWMFWSMGERAAEQARDDDFEAMRVFFGKEMDSLDCSVGFNSDVSWLTLSRLYRQKRIRMQVYLTNIGIQELDAEEQRLNLKDIRERRS